MKTTARIISTYSADSFGVSSAMFELGGMTVMHDPSGCNSTYTTHDEPRWMDMDSMVFISGLTEMEAIMGDDEKFINDVVTAASELHPRFITICGSPVPMMTGFDFDAVAAVIEERSGIPCIGLKTFGMQTYIHGASLALAAIAERFVREVDESEIANPVGMFTSRGGSGSSEFFDSTRVNVLGLTPLDFSVNGTDQSICCWLEQNNFDIVSTWAMDCDLDDLIDAAVADVNLVVSASGLGAAEVLYQRFGIPYVTGVPIGDAQQDRIAEALRNAAFTSRLIRHSGQKGAPRAGDRRGCTRIFSDLSENSETPDRAGIVIIGEGITSLALATAIELEKGHPARVLCATDCPGGILRPQDVMAPDEDDIIPELEGAEVIIADPLYRPICPESAEFIPLPTEAFSGRLYRQDIPDLVLDPQAILGKL